MSFGVRFAIDDIVIRSTLSGDVPAAMRAAAVVHDEACVIVELLAPCGNHWRLTQAFEVWATDGLDHARCWFEIDDELYVGW